MEILFVGDVVGEEATHWLADRIPELRDQLGLDYVIVNAENCAVTGPNPMDGFGLTTDLLHTLLDAGVDVITGGNHSWDGPDVDKVLSHYQVARPHNVNEDLGQGVITIGGGENTLTVINLLSPTAALPGMKAPTPQPLWPAWQHLCATEPLQGTVIIDLHGESAWEKASFATAVDGHIEAVLGTHTHDATLHTHRLNGGTAYVTEVGMTGRLGHTGGGFDPAHFAAKLRGEDHTTLPPYRLSTGPMTMGAVHLTTTNQQSANTAGIRRVH